jgi:hypothetical protein
MTILRSGDDWKTGRLVVVITADEDAHHQNNRVLTVVAHPSLRGVVSHRSLSHYSLSRSYSQMAGPAPLCHARHAASLLSGDHLFDFLVEDLEVTSPSSGFSAKSLPSLAVVFRKPSSSAANVGLTTTQEAGTMTTSKAHPAAVKRDAAHRRVRGVTLGVAAVAVGVTSYGALTLAQMTADGSMVTVGQQSATGVNVSSGTGQAPAASSGGS